MLNNHTKRDCQQHIDLVRAVNLLFMNNLLAYLRLFLLILSAFWGLGYSDYAQAMRCGTRLVSTGDIDVQVQARCGEPYWRSQRREFVSFGVGGPVELRREIIEDIWYYNFGSNSLIRMLRFRDGTLYQIDTLGYGRGKVGGDCTEVAVSRGSSEGEVVLRCGQPLSRSTFYEDRVIRDGSGRELIRPVSNERWRYRIPGSRFLHELVIRDGKVEAVRLIDIN